MKNTLQNDKDVILDSIADGVFTVDNAWRVTSFNRAAEEITGVKREAALGRPCRDVLKADLCQADCALRHSMETGEPIINRPVHIVDAQGRRKSITISTAIMRDAAGHPIGGVETFRDMTMVEQLRKQIQKEYTCEDILSRNHKIQDYFSILPQIAQSNCAVLIDGETGTGKEVFARTLHTLSPRKDKAFVAVNCSALPDALLESELFGYKAGAFTDAKQDKPGRFALAEGGTLFLDEIGDVSPAVQVRFLRFLQEKTYEPVGGIETVKADVRIIAATNRDLDQLVSQSTFRKDLYYRINVVRLSLPPLRERKEDIPMLMERFIERFNSLYDKHICCVSNDVLAGLMTYDFPGNIRELENIIEHGFVLCSGQVIEKQHLPVSLRNTLHPRQGASPRFKTLKQMEAVMIERALERNKGNRAAAARELGINTSTLFRKLKAL